MTLINEFGIDELFSGNSEILLENLINDINTHKIGLI